MRFPVDITTQMSLDGGNIKRREAATVSVVGGAAEAIGGGRFQRRAVAAEVRRSCAAASGVRLSVGV